MPGIVPLLPVLEPLCLVWYLAKLYWVLSKMISKDIVMRSRLEGTSKGTKGDVRGQPTARILCKSCCIGTDCHLAYIFYCLVSKPLNTVCPVGHAGGIFCHSSLELIHLLYLQPFLPAIVPPGLAPHVPYSRHRQLLHRTRALNESEDAQAKSEELFQSNGDSSLRSTYGRSQSLSSQGVLHA